MSLACSNTAVVIRPFGATNVDHKAQVHAYSSADQFKM